MPIIFRLNFRIKGIRHKNKQVLLAHGPRAAEVRNPRIQPTYDFHDIRLK